MVFLNILINKILSRKTHMRREGIACLSVSKWTAQKEAAELSEFGANDYYKSLAKFYNHHIATNRTINLPWGCHNGKTHCPYCGKFERSGKYRRITLHEQLRYDIDDATSDIVDDFIYDD